MSAGPIRSERAAWTPPLVSTPDVDRVCRATATRRRGYCGRSSAPVVASWDDVTCADCHAARRADRAAL